MGLINHYNSSLIFRIIYHYISDNGYIQAINDGYKFLQKAKTKRQSIKRLRKMAGWDELILEHILQQQLS